MRASFVVICACSALMFTACTGSISPSQLEPPAKALMVPPAKLSDLKAGDDLVMKHAELRRDASTEKDRLRRLQRYVRTITQK